MHRWYVAWLLGLWATAACASESDIGIRAPEGFEATVFADDALAHDIYSMTIDSQGRVVVAGAGYVKTLHDDDRDGRADRATLFSNIPASGAHGMCFDGNDLICTGDNALMRLRDTDGDGTADGEREAWANLRNPEHGANGIVRGPDGWFYVICGNDAGVSSEHAGTPASPVSKPECGAVLRFAPDGSRSEIVAHGFRNPYDLAFNAEGSLFTVDADGERDQHLPWYSPTRLFDVAQGKHHGWVLQGWQRSWNRPPWFFDSADRLVEIGRGSPTGVIVYQHRQFPGEYRGAVFSCCWTLGRVYAFPLERAGSTYASRQEIFLETTGQVGFAPVDVAIGTAGEMYVAIGGRRTRGSVFRVQYRGGASEAVAADDLTAVLEAEEPLSAWSRAMWLPKARKLGADVFPEAAEQHDRPVWQRLRAIEVLTDVFQGVPLESAERLSEAIEPAVRARLAWSLARRPQGALGLQLLSNLTWDDDAVTQRAAWDALASLERSPDGLSEANWSAMHASADRRVRFACLLADARHHPEVTMGTEAAPSDAALAKLWQLHLRGRLAEEHAEFALQAGLSSQSISGKIEALRLVVLAFGDIDLQPATPDVVTGYTLKPERVPSAINFGERWSARLAQMFPSGSRELDLELARLCGMLRINNPTFTQRLAEQWTESSSVTDDIHYLFVLSQLPSFPNADLAERTATALLGLHEKMADEQRYPSRNWPQRLADAFEQLCQRDPQLALALASSPFFRLPQHSLYVLHMPTAHQTTAARRLLSALGDLDEEWTPELVEMVALLPDAEAFSILREHWEEFGVRDAILRVLARSPQLEDWPRFIESLASAQPEIVGLAAKALLRLQQRPGDADWVALMKALRLYARAEQYKTVRQALIQLVKQWGGEELLTATTEDKDPVQNIVKLETWFESRHPELVAQVKGFGDDLQAWRDRLASVPWSAGEIAAGKVVFERRSCQRCHAGSSPLGPDLAGVTSRLSREDLFAHIVDPNREVSPLYQTTQVVTGSGKVVVGLIVYESPESTLVQTDPDTTVRIAGEEILAMRKSNTSLMPVGLLNDVNDQELADLYAYLETLRAKQ